MPDFNDIDQLLEWAEKEASQGLSAKEREAMESSRQASTARIEQEMEAARIAGRLQRRRRIIAWSSAAASLAIVALVAISLLIPPTQHPANLASQSPHAPAIKKNAAVSNPDTLNVFLSSEAPAASTAPARILASTDKPTKPSRVKNKKTVSEFSYDEECEPSEEELIAANYRVVTTQEEADAIIAPAISTFEANNALNFATLAASVAELSPDNFSQCD